MKISIIIPAYNVEAYLKYCVDSVVHQHADCSIETIIVDDGSTDGTPSICDSYVDRPGVKIFHKSNGGLSSARNAGFDAATGDYILFLDGDDYLADGALAYLSKIAQSVEEPVDFIQFKYIEVQDYNNAISQIGGTKVVETVRDKHEIFRRKLLLGGIGASACTKLIRRSVLTELRFKEGIIHEDEQFTSHLIDNIKDGVIYLDAELYCYVMRQGSIIKSKFTRKKLDVVPILEEQVSILERNGYDDLANIVRSRLFISLCLLYKDTRDIEDKDSERFIASTAIALAKDGKMNLSYKFGTIARGLKYHLPMLQCYYIFTNIIGNG